MILPDLQYRDKMSTLPGYTMAFRFTVLPSDIIYRNDFLYPIRPFGRIEKIQIGHFE